MVKVVTTTTVFTSPSYNCARPPGLPVDSAVSGPCRGRESDGPGGQADAKAPASKPESQGEGTRHASRPLARPAY